MDASQDLDERALAGAVLADERVDLARLQLEGHIVECLRGTEPHRDADERCTRRDGDGLCEGFADRHRSTPDGVSVSTPLSRGPARWTSIPRDRSSAIVGAGASSSATTARRSDSRQKVANAERPHLELSTMPMTSWAASAIARLICASSSVASLSPDSRLKPAAPRNAFWTLTLRKSPSPNGPTTDRASQRTKPPGITTVIPGIPANPWAIRRPFVMTVRCTQPPRRRRC